MGKFNGIVEYHDGIAVSEYMNMLPMGEICLDRVGDKLKLKLPSTFQKKFRGCFKDSEDRAVWCTCPDAVLEERGYGRARLAYWWQRIFLRIQYQADYRVPL